MGTWSNSSIEDFVAVPLDPSVTAARASKRALSGRVPFDPSRSIAKKGGGVGKWCEVKRRREERGS